MGLTREAGTRAAAVVLLMVLALAFGAFGAWQWQRAEQSRARLAQLAAASVEPPLSAPVEDHEAAAALRYRPLAVRGHYEPRLQFLLDNRVHDGEAGYEVLTPFRLLGDERRLLVNRGWVKASPDRRVLPDVTVDDGERSLRGRIDTLPRPGITLSAAAAAHDAREVLVVSYPSAAELEERLGTDAFGYQVLLDPAEPDGYGRDWQIAGPAPKRHIAYAGQWWLLALGAAGAAAVMAVRGLRAARRP